MSRLPLVVFFILKGFSAPHISGQTVTDANCGLSDGSICVAPGGGTSPYTYSWMPGGATTACITGLAGGIDTVVITDASGCSDTFTIPVNLAGLPAISVPVKKYTCPSSELPVGFQLIGKWWREADILGLGQLYEKIGE